jgi:quercetin 2,3-dioxygenase
MTQEAVIRIQPLGFPWQTLDPFLFCAYHDDAYPRGDARMAPAASLAGRDIGQDFSRKDGWSMYHGEHVPGFPAHPHRGFETVTIVRRGLVDHSDSLGATARFGGGDVQWLTAGKGIVHCEMFPLTKTDQDNPLELFQIWLNLPAKNKMAEPYFTMFWHEDIQRRSFQDADGRSTEVVCIAGTLADAKGLPPPPDSWASASGSDVAIYTLRVDAGASWVLPAAQGQGTRRQLYFFKGSSLQVAGREVPPQSAIEVRAGQDTLLHSGPQGCELLMLQGRPIGEPVAQYGPFVMNTQMEIQQAFNDYRSSGFGGWPWGPGDPVHARAQGRFAKHADGQVEAR